MILLISISAVTIFVAGIISMIEAALFSFPLYRARLNAAENKFNSKRVLEIRENPFRTIAAFVILSSTSSVMGSVLVGSVAAKEFDSLGIGIFSAFLTFLSITFSEIIPKNIGERWSHIIFPIAATPLYWLTVILTPLVLVFETISKPFTVGASPFVTSEDEITLLTREGAKEGTIEKREAEMIQRVFKLNDVTAGDMMTPKPFVKFINGDKLISEIRDDVISAKHSRIPVFEGDQNHIVGIVHRSELLRAIAIGDIDKKVSAMARKALTVSDSRLGDDLLNDFQENRSHLAIVVSEYGNVVGVVGLEDVLEELVGEIIDEKDVIPETIKRISRNEVLAHGQTKISNLNHFFNISINSKKTLHGYLFEKFGYMPKIEEVYMADDVKFIIEDVSAHEITKVRVTKK